MKTIRACGPTLLGASVILLLGASVALGAGGESVGQNLGALLRSWATGIYGGVVAIVSIVFLINRRYNELVMFVGAALLVGGFVFAPDAVTGAVRDIWRVIAG